MYPFSADSYFRFESHIVFYKESKQKADPKAGLKAYLRRIYAGIPSMKERGVLRSSCCSCAGACWLCIGISGIAA